MNILVTSLPDIGKLPFQRFHHLLGYLSLRHNISILCINAWWLNDVPDSYVQELLERIDLNYITGDRINPIYQELLMVKNFTKLNKMLSFGDFDVHINFASLIGGFFITKRLNSLSIPTVIDVYDDFPEMIRRSPRIPPFLQLSAGYVSKFLLDKNMQMANKITFTNGLLMQSYNLPVEKSVLVPNGVDTERFSPQYSSFLKTSLCNDDCFILGFVGFLSTWVNLDPVFAAIKDLISNNLIHNIKLLVVGGGEKLFENKQLAKNYGIENEVIFTGAVPFIQVPKYISIMDICLICFKDTGECQNSSPLKLMEYMACSKPIISTQLASVKSDIGDRVLYASNKEELKKQIMLLYHDRCLRNKLGKTGKEFVTSNYNWSNICPKFEDILQQLI